MAASRSSSATTAKCDTIVSLRDYIESRLDSQEKAVGVAKELMEARMTIADKSLEYRLHNLNKLRDDVITKTEYLASHNTLTVEFHAEAACLRSEISALKEWKAEMKGKASMTSVYIAYGVSAISLVLAITQLIYEIIAR